MCARLCVCTCPCLGLPEATCELTLLPYGSPITKGMTPAPPLPLPLQGPWPHHPLPFAQPLQVCVSVIAAVRPHAHGYTFVI